MKNDKITMTEDELKKVIKETVKDTLLTLGCQTDDPIEMQKDFSHLRDWRKSTEAVKKKGMVTALGFIIVSVLGLGLKAFLGDG